MHKPHPRQLDLEYSRADKLGILRDCRLGDPKKRNDRKPLAKLLLRTLDDHIGQNRTWSFTVEELAIEAEMSISSAYQWLAWLNAAGFVGFDPLPDGRREYWICWNSLKATTPAGSKSNATPSPRVQNTDRHSTMRNGGPDCGPSFHNLESHNKEERPCSAHITPPPPPPQNDSVVAAVKSAGVEKFVEAVAAGRASGQSDEQLLAVVAFYLAPNNAGAWGPGALFDRLSTPSGASLPPDQGWPPRKIAAKPLEPKTAAAAVDLEQRYGPRLDSMPEAELRSRISSKRLLYDLERSGRHDFRVRGALLQAVHEAEGNSA